VSNRKGPPEFTHWSEAFDLARLRNRPVKVRMIHRPGTGCDVRQVEHGLWKVFPSGHVQRVKGGARK